MDILVRVLWTLLVGSQSFVFGRLIQLGIIGRYKFFGSYLAISIARFVCLVWLPVDGKAYCTAWFVSEPLLFAATGAVCWEAYSLLCSYFPGNQRFFTRVSLIAGTIAATLSALLFRVDARFDVWLRVMFWATRFIAVESAIFLLIALLVVRPFSLVQERGTMWPIRSWNNRAHVTCCASLFCVIAASYTAADILGTGWHVILNCMWLPAASALFICWGVILKRSGDCVEVPRISAQEEEYCRELEAERIRLLTSLKPAGSVANSWMPVCYGATPWRSRRRIRSKAVTSRAR